MGNLQSDSWAIAQSKTAAPPQLTVFEALSRLNFHLASYSIRPSSIFTFADWENA
jgi:hypothetical protein